MGAVAVPLPVLDQPGKRVQRPVRVGRPGVNRGCRHPRHPAQEAVADQVGQLDPPLEGSDGAVGVLLAQRLALDIVEPGQVRRCVAVAVEPGEQVEGGAGIAAVGQGERLVDVAEGDRVAVTGASPTSRS